MENSGKIMEKSGNLILEIRWEPWNKYLGRNCRPEDKDVKEGGLSKNVSGLLCTL